MCDGSKLSRRELFASARKLANMSLAFAALGPFSWTIAARADQVPPDDPRMHTEAIVIPTDAGGLQSYLARPVDGSAILGNIIVAHDYWGLTPHFRDVGRRFAVEGFRVLAPDFASRLGGTPTERDPARDMINMLDWPDVISDGKAAIAWMRGQEGTNGRVGIVGFGWGGSTAGRLATKASDLDSGVIYYGKVPPAADVPAIKAQLLLNYAGEDPLVDPDVPDFTQALQRTGVTYQVFIYDGVQRGFDDDSTPAHYAADAAQLAWTRTIEFLRQTLA
jgi:carboxymethylenebutenolidase